MVNVDKHVAHWREGSEEAFEVAGELLHSARYGFALFFAHLAIEKLLKAHVTKVTAQPPPRTHDLLRLSSLAGLKVSKVHGKVLAQIEKFQIEGRYPAGEPVKFTRQQAQALFEEAKEVLQWLTHQL